MVKKYKKLFPLFIIIILIIVIFFTIKINNNSKRIENKMIVVPVLIEDENTKYLDIFAKGGYSPDEIVAKADTEYVLRMTTKSTFDCSSALVIRKLGVSELLKNTGVYKIKIPPQKKGTQINGSCSMGMYSFSIKFE